MSAEKLSSWLRFNTRCIGLPQSGQSVAFSGQVLDEGGIYLVIPTGAVWLRLDGGTVLSRTPPARLFTGPGLVIGQGQLPEGITDNTVTTTQAVAIEGPIAPELAWRLLTGEAGCAG